ncbi:MAG: PilZ domain-containing protein [Syntrophobacteraceae bacterium]|nr:PilZ domain-containing protein [Desulfobacteraceae bacterium]
MWPFQEQTREKRYPVDWEARLRLAVPDPGAVMAARIVDISLGGARLALERMRIGSYHLCIGDRPGSLYLSIALAEDTVEAAIEIRWFNWNEKLKAFLVGAEFSRMDLEAKSLLSRAVSALPEA